MRSSVSYILSHAPGESVMSHPDYAQHAQHHACLLVLVKGIGGVLKNFNKLWERIQRVNNIKVTDSSGQVRDIWVRYVRDYPVENNDWGDFQTHRRLLGLITLSKFANQVELNEVCRVHESLKVKYSNTLYDSRAFMFGPGSNLKKPEQEPETYSFYEDDKTKEKTSLSDKISLPSEAADSLSSCDSIAQSSSSTYSVQEENFTTPSNFKTHALFYGENDPVPDLEQHVAELINSLFWVVESKRLERSREKLEKVSLLLAPFEKRDFVGLDMESRNNKKRCMGRVTKNLADLTLQAGLVPEALSLYNSAGEILKSVNDWLWLGAAKEGHCVTSAIIQYPHLRNSTPLQRNASLQESSPNKTKPLSLYQPPSEPYRKFKLNFSPLKTSKTSSPINAPNELTPSSSESLETSSRQSETDNADTESLASSTDIEYQSQKSYLSPDLPSIPRQPTSIHTMYLLSGEEIAEKYRKATIHYSKYQNAGIIETEACFKAARIAVEQNNTLRASSFLQNVIFINLTLSEQEKIQRFDTLAELYKEIGFLRKAAFCQRLAATRQVSANNPNPDWPRCYHLMLHSFPGHKISLDPNYAVQHQVGWPALQIQLLHELVVAARRMGHPALATRHMTFLLQTMWPHLSRQEHRDLAIQLQALSAQCEGGPVPLVLETGEVIPPANLTHVPTCLYFNPRPLPPARTPHLIKSKSNQGPFIFTPIHFGSLERKTKKDEGKMEYLWVEDDICEVQMKLTNPLPFELKVSNMRLLTSGVVFESIPETIILPPDSPTTVNLHGTPKEVGELLILGYSTHTLGVKSNCRLKNMPMPHKFPSAFSIEVIPSLPRISIETTLTLSGNVNISNPEISASVTNISLYNGESTECTIKITNTSNVAIEYLDLLIQSNMDNQLQRKVFQWSNEDIQSQLPIKPTDVASIPITLYGEADFLDLGGENVFPNSLTSNYPSRVGSPVPNAQTSLPTQSSNQQNSLSSGLMVNRTSGSFRSSNSQTTSWSAPISIMPPSRGRQIETQIVLRYSGGAGKDLHCRQSTLQMNLELLPSVSITHWDVLPAEIPSQLYLVLDITNLTNEEMDFEYAPSKHILIEGKESCRVPVPLDRCPFTSTAVKIEDADSMEPKSISTGTSINSLEVMCSEHLTKNVDLKWHLLQSNINGRASVKGITLSQSMMDIVRMSPLNWEVSLNKQYIKPQEEYNCTAGECLFLGVAVSNHLKRPLHKLCLSVQFYQDYNNGVRNYKLDNRVATAGNNKVVLTTLSESAKAYHECTVVFLTPGEYKIDIQCSTTEPILDDISIAKDLPSVQSCAEEISHTWRFIPPVAISVTD
ncbi:protein brunelleschi isoform X1 [Danaus plexippus]|uniref:protein brunelleschi isoform X1 n=1 Tax=Danaus plexippus TaxID=13037 RepID=UPI002AB2978C|nr:protein brunelleschi isoform X1 [Danaus plexippus]